MPLFDPLLSSFLARAVGPLQLASEETPRWAAARASVLRGEELVIHSAVWSGPKVRRARVSRILSPSAFEAFNLLIIPWPESGAPIFGSDFLSAGSRVPLAVVDFQDMRKDDPAWQARWIAPLAPIARQFEAITTPASKMHEWTSKFFSPHALLVKPVNDLLPRCLDAFDRYLELYVHMLSIANPIEEPEEIDRMRVAHREYHRDHIANEPGVRALARFFGDEWAARYTREFLFDGADGVPSQDSGDRR